MTHEECKEMIEKRLSRHTTLATLWSIVRRVQHLTSDPNSSSRDLVQVIGTDSVLTSRVLRLVNSSAYGFSRRIGNLDEAVVMLGYGRIRDLCTSLAAINGLENKTDSKGFNRSALWRHSLGTAIAARLIQSRLIGTREPDLFVAGLLSNIGRIILDQYFPEEFAKVQEFSASEQVSMLEAERAVLGASHADIGYWAAKQWHLSTSLANTIRRHHGPVQTDADRVVNLAYVVAQALGIGSPGDPVMSPILPGTIEALELSADDLTSMLRDIMIELDKTGPLFTMTNP